MASSAALLFVPAPLLIATAAIFIPVDIGMVGLRIWARKLKGISLGADDYTCTAACVFTVAMAITIIIETSQKTIGYSTAVSIDSDAKNAEAAWYPLAIFQSLSIGLVKMSFLLFYQRIFVKGASPRFYKLCWSIIICTALWTIIFTFAWIFVCGTSPEYLWHAFPKRKGHCVEPGALIESFAVTDFVFDVLIISMPIPMIWRLNLSTVRRVQLSGIFLLGAVSVAASCVRLAVLLESVLALYTKSSDIESIDSNVIYWTILESGLAICVACLPTLSFFATREGLRSALQSARWALSLHSMFSNGPRQSNRPRQTGVHEHEASQNADALEAYTRMTRSNLGPSDARVQAEVSHELRDFEEADLRQAGGIVVGKTLTQSSEPARS